MSGLTRAALRNTESVAVIGPVRAQRPARQISASRTLPQPVLQEDDRSNFTFRITRATTNIAESLPVPLFAPLHAAAGWSDFAAPFQANGVSISTTSDLFFSATGTEHVGPNVTISYFDGVGTDVCTISCVNVSYKVMLAALLSDSMKAYEMKFSVAAANVAQFDEEVSFVNSTGYGRVNYDSIVPSDYIDPYQNQANQVVVGEETVLGLSIPPFNRSRGMVVNMSQIVGLTYTISISLSSRYLQQ